MPTDPWDNPTKVYPIGIHSSNTHSNKSEYPVRAQKQMNPSLTVEHPAYLNKHLVGVHGDMLFYEEEPHWRLNPALIRS